MSVCVDLRLFNKVGLRTEHIIPVDISGIPSGSLVDFSMHWNCRRTVDEPSASISLNSIDNPSQVIIVDPTEASVKVILFSNDTLGLNTGAYYWQLDLNEISGSMTLAYPAVGYGDIIFQPSMS